MFSLTGVLVVLLRARLIVGFVLSWAVVFRTSPRGGWVGGGVAESQLVWGFYFYAPSCPGGARGPSPTPSTPQYEAGKVCWVETVDCLDE